MSAIAKALAQTAHRPWPLPAGPWVMTQTWYDLLFAHWPVPVADLRHVVPPQLELDTYEGQAWLGVVPFGMSRVYPRFTFPVPWLSVFLELNVRTYVRVGAKPGVYFFSLDAANPAAVEIARRTYRLPYYNARMSKQADGDWLDYSSYRTHRGAPPAELRARYRPTGEVYLSQPGTLESWLTERYCLYTFGRANTVLRGEIHHAPWPLQPAEAEITANSMAAPHGLTLPDTPPLLHFVRSILTVEWPIGPAAG
ncbi:MAG: DUF2071 domain-containing protein [Anaerolineales bacterium]|nr:DUF2071 domain-containing protein [Anaerolineales bacterium]